MPSVTATRAYSRVYRIRSRQAGGQARLCRGRLHRIRSSEADGVGEGLLRAHIASGISGRGAAAMAVGCVQEWMMAWRCVMEAVMRSFQGWPRRVRDVPTYLEGSGIGGESRSR